MRETSATSKIKLHEINGGEDPTRRRRESTKTRHYVEIEARPSTTHRDFYSFLRSAER